MEALGLAAHLRARFLPFSPGWQGDVSSLSLGSPVNPHGASPSVKPPLSPVTAALKHTPKLQLTLGLLRLKKCVANAAICRYLPAVSPGSSSPSWSRAVAIRDWP